jgi:hypothetical protein
VFSVTVAVVFKIIFYSKMHLNNIFFILKNLFFDISILKQFKNIKKFKIFGTVVIQKYKHKINTRTFVFSLFTCASRNKHISPFHY